MKWIAIIAVCLAVLLYGLNTLKRAENPPEVGLEQRKDGLYYKAGAETAFTGDGLVYHSNKQKAQEGKIENGKPTGPWKIWHPNGQLHWEGSYKDGKRDGVWIQYDETGAKMKDVVEQAPPPETGQSPAATPAASTGQKPSE